MLRARKAEDKEGRRRLILGAARDLLDANPSHVALAMADVAERASLAKGTVYIYYPTKEALLLGLLEEELTSWLDLLDARLDHGGTWTPKRVAQLIAETLDERRMLTRLLALMSNILEHNVPEEVVVSFKTFLQARVAATGARLEKRLSFLREGEGARVIVLCHALVTGLQPMAEPPPVVAKVLERPDLAAFRVDFAKDLAAAVWALLLGMSEIAEGRRS